MSARVRLASGEEMRLEMARHRARRRAREAGFVGLGLRHRSGKEGAGYPSTLALDGWWRDYVSLPWVGTASAGTSAAKSITGSVGTPAAGATQSGRPSVTFTTTATRLTSSVLMSDLITTTAHTFWMIFRFTGTVAGRILGCDTSVSIWDVDQLASTTRVAVQHSSENPGAAFAVADTVPHIFMTQMTGGGSQSTQLDGAAPVSTGGVTIPALGTEVLDLGARSGFSDACTAVEIWEFGFMKSAQADFAAWALLMREYARSRYAFEA